MERNNFRTLSKEGMKGLLFFSFFSSLLVSEPVLLKPKGDKHWGESIAEPGSLMSALIREEMQESTVRWHLDEYKFSPDRNSSTVGLFPDDSVSERREKQFRSSVLILLTLLEIFKKSKLWLFYLQRQQELVKDSLTGSDNGQCLLSSDFESESICLPGGGSTFKPLELSRNWTGRLSR